MARRLATLLLAGAALLTGGCATVGPATGTAPSRATSAADPWERFNRRMFAFNEAVDEAVLRPVATAYQNVVPPLLRSGVANFFGNFEDAWSAVNHLLQGKVERGLEMGFRVVVNSTFGMGGVLDPATEMRLERQPEDLGQTLGAWGLPAGPYVMLPLLGPTTVRDGLAKPVDLWASPSRLTRDDGKRVLGSLLDAVETRAALLTTTKLIGDVAFDRYIFVRDAYLARRLELLWDGAPPFEDFPPDDAPAATPGPAPAR